MKIYELAESEEYSLQVSHGLWANKDKAIAKGIELCRASY
jgi:hypothetical protein